MKHSNTKINEEEKNSSFVRNLQDRALEKFLSTLDIQHDFQSHEIRGVTIVIVNLSRAVIAESQQFYQYIFELISKGSSKFIVDLTSLEFIDSSFAGVLVAALRKVKSKNGDIRLILKPNTPLTKQLHFVGMLKVYKTFSTVYEALEDY